MLSCTDDTQTVAKLNTLVMADEFDTPGAPNSTLWNYDIGTGQNGWGNNELQFYTDRASNVTVQNGYLIITAQKESYNGSSYTSARILTKGKFEQAYGRFEARMKLPWGQGVWPAFWMLGADIDSVGWPTTGEIDIMELRGQDPTVLLGTIHGPGYSGGQSISKSYTLKNGRFDTDFHVFGIEWGPSYINFYVDDVLYNQITPANVPQNCDPELFNLNQSCWVFNKPFFILINLAIGGNFVGAPNGNTVFPQTMLVDYVRVYK
ncbi:MAG: glycoside hydrolase family 16 protein [Cyclobacteriaceae bacterium]|nr:glycoside hydrolase family 16 protein [Cyclobacteriaceae bacterium]